mmetsp:Transcript_16894/g.47971  ORF Transcript_16894/g.47971 Transcript_16894/m.47971 type:complete len:257 (-) Transcript_16894:1103-1873(-)
MNSNKSCRNAFNWPTWSPSKLGLSHNLARIGASAGLHLSMSAGWLGPSFATTSSTVLSFRILHKSSMSCAAKGKFGGHIPVSLPISFKVFAKIFGTAPLAIQPPQPVPALVVPRMSSNVIAPPLIASLMVRFVTSLHVQTKSSSATLVPSPPSSTGTVSATCSIFRGPRFGFFDSAASFPHWEMSPRRMPPSSLVPSGVKTSFLYVPFASSCWTMFLTSLGSSEVYSFSNQKLAAPPNEAMGTPMSFSLVVRSLPR